MSIVLRVFMNTIGERLKAERTRLGFNQTEFAAVGGVQRRAQVFYEQDERRPDAGYLQAVARLGVDIQFVVTGVKSSQALTVEEEQLLAGFRNLDLMAKVRVLGVIEGAVPHEKPMSRHVVSIGGSVGHQVNGDVHGTVNNGNVTDKVKAPRVKSEKK
ncbi:helix-turn-helix transcriptional regulator [uncultured Herbaspirillum sp.]|uniref:helix-turn-helix domain-containing protein n=1 Tax=uncultured Herbaspirillum sp. TaxID=160236 RepID=UPI002590FA82|nr:helix-turn-helix transcriptional regulator [uncultured Herbaspirillum sp.]